MPLNEGMEPKRARRGNRYPCPLRKGNESLLNGRGSYFEDVRLRDDIAVLVPSTRSSLMKYTMIFFIRDRDRAHFSSIMRVARTMFDRLPVDCI